VSSHARDDTMLHISIVRCYLYVRAYRENVRIELRSPSLPPPARPDRAMPRLLTLVTFIESQLGTVETATRNELPTD
jgi:hypothetical protein